MSEIVNADAELSRRVLEVDPKAAPPKLSRKDAAAPIIPVLPTSAALSQEAIKAASSAGSWIDDCIRWLKTRASMSSALFLEAGALWAAAVVIAGRLRLLSLFGATIPARLGMNIGQEQWHDGMLARFALITPTETHIPRCPATLVPDLDPPPELVQRLIELDRALPTPPYRDAAARLDDDGEPPVFPSLSVQITPEALEACNRYADALHALCAPNRGLDERVKGNYGRLDKLAMKVAITLAALDWQPGQSGVPVIAIGHWARGQQTAERWRESLHRLLFDLSRSDDSQTEQTIISLLARRAGVTERVNPHSFRHSFAREYLREGGDLSTLSRLMGHRDVTTTVHHYAIFTQDEIKEAHEKYSPAKHLGEANENASSGDEA